MADALSGSPGGVNRSLIEATEWAVEFLTSVEWSDTSSETTAADVRHALETALEAAEAAQPQEQVVANRVIADLYESLRTRYLFGRFDEPLDDAGLRIVRVIQQRLIEGSAEAAQPQEQEPTEQPNDATGRGRLLLNAYGRRCYDAGYEAAKGSAEAAEK